MLLRMLIMLSDNLFILKQIFRGIFYIKVLNEAFKIRVDWVYKILSTNILR